MPRYPNLSDHAAGLPSSVLARLYECCAGREDIVPFHVGNTHLSPPPAARLGAVLSSAGDDPGLYGYAGPRGEPALVDALADKLRRENGIASASADTVQITSGATHALSLALRAVASPGDDFLCLAPYWPMIRGVAASAGARLVEIEAPGDLRAGASDEELAERVAARVAAGVTPRACAIYVSNPQNPDGRVYTRAELAGLVRAAARHDLWIVSDEVYEAFPFDGRAHQSVAALPDAAPRTLTAFSFSKSYGQAGLRVGYLVGPETAVAAARDLVFHGVYGVPLATQRAALAALERGGEFLAQARAHYQEARDLARARLELDAPAPEGGTYLFVDMSPALGPGEADALPVLERLARAGVLLVPGYAFGAAYGRYARLCFSAVPPGEVAAGIERVNRALWRRGPVE